MPPSAPPSAPPPLRTASLPTARRPPTRPHLFVRVTLQNARPRPRAFAPRARRAEYEERGHALTRARLRAVDDLLAAPAR